MNYLLPMFLLLLIIGVYFMKYTENYIHTIPRLTTNISPIELNSDINPPPISLNKVNNISNITPVKKSWEFEYNPVVDVFTPYAPESHNTANYFPSITNIPANKLIPDAHPFTQSNKFTLIDIHSYKQPLKFISKNPDLQSSSKFHSRNVNQTVAATSSEINSAFGAKF